MNSIKKIYGLIGKKLGHSFSRDFFNKKFATENLSAEYVNFEIDTIEEINKIISSTPNLVGLNVTILEAIGSICESRGMTASLKSTDKNALMLGTGGAAKAMTAGLRSLGIDVSTVSRSKELADYTYSELTDQVINHHSIIVNSTPLGMWPDTDSTPNIPYEFITANHIAFDAVYNPNPTKFLTLCQQNGATIKSGLEMLYGQAIAAWNIWNNTIKI